MGRWKAYRICYIDESGYPRSWGLQAFSKDLAVKEFKRIEQIFGRRWRITKVEQYAHKPWLRGYARKPIKVWKMGGK